MLRMNVRCPACSNVYDWQKLRILGERDQQLLTFIECGTCGTSLLSILSLGQTGITAHGLVTDLTVDEVIDLENWGAVNPDDVINLHQLLEREQANFLTDRKKGTTL